MANEIAKWEPSSKIGPKMAALPTDRHRLFVESLFVCKPGAGNMVAAARRAGWGKPDGSSIPIVMTNIASRLMRDPRVQEAILEVSKQQFRGMLPEAMNALKELVRNPFSAHHYRALQLLFDREMPSQTIHHVEVTHRDETITPEVMARIDAFAERYKLNMPPLPAPTPDAIEVEYEEVDNAPSTAGLEDVLGLSDEIENDEENEP